jgi:hypothetical protein
LVCDRLPAANSHLSKKYQCRKPYRTRDERDVVLLPAAVLADTLILNNGRRVQGTVVGIASNTLTFRHTDGVAHRYPTSQIDELRFVADSAGRRTPAIRSFEAPAGTELVVRTVETIDSRHARQPDLRGAGQRASPMGQAR